MDNIKNDEYYLNKIKEDLIYIINNSKGLTEDKIKTNETLIKAFSFSIIQISENSKFLSSDFKNKNSSIPRHLIIGLRNKIVHDYGGINLSSLLNTILYDIPEMYNNLKENK